ncbi:glycine cleavage system protein GcvH [Solimonas terrae]|uniref:Glycine cleavage system H protein n=1 Tax=Solimonas terrae TaxID=1396819 RepID=A0A6M2BQ92_9GAMM|nr:glycine cleavage system protein GcvH [Solimonas terrae]NGY04618.1 glycine cleavage system protein GcvH [Solimonas terrae]
MSNVPAELKYAKSHEWVRRESDGSVTIGITDFAQGSLGDLVFVEMPAAGRKLGKDESCAVVESVKAASDVYAPIAGEVIASNAKLGDSPEILNSDPYREGWMWKMKPANAAELDALLDAAAYEDFLKTL